MTIQFRPNQFYGNLQDRRQGGVFDISVLQATAPEHAVREHMHVDAHFVLVLAGTYISIAQGAPDAAWLESGVWDLLAATDAAPGTATRQPPSWMRHAYEAVMDSAGYASLSIGEIALAAGVHPVHLARVFHEALGCSPGELLRWRRIEHACTLLRQPGRSMSDVAFETGFVDQSHMAHAFRRRFGMPPGAWRRAMFQGYKTVPSLAG